MPKTKYLLLIGAYHVLVCGTVLGLLLCFAPSLVKEGSWLNFDAAHYKWIAEHGYEGFRMAFFPLFPMIWRLLVLGVHGVVLLNALIYLVSLCALCFLLRPDWKALLAWFCVPSAIFYFLPYTEAMFFAGGTLLLIGVSKDRMLATVSGLLICSLTRPAFTALLPAFCIMEWLRTNDKRTFLIRCAIYLTVCLSGLAIVALVQHHDTGQWLGFYHEQNGWGNSLRLPKLPLGSWGGNTPVRHDAVAFLIGMASIGYLVRSRWTAGDKTRSVPPEVTLSCGYMGFISLLALFTRGGELFSLNRFIMATPFMLVLIHYYLKSSIRFTLKQFVLLFVFLLAYFLLFGSYVHIQAFLKFAVLSLYLMLFALLPQQSQQRTQWAFPVWFAATVLLQVFFYLSFLQGFWVA